MRGQRTGTLRARLATAVATVALVAGVTAQPAHAGLIGTVTAPVVGLVDAVTAGWDDGVTTAPVSMATVANAIGADELWARGVDGAGVGVALIDSGVVPVDGLDGAGKVVNGPDLSFESQAADYRYLDTFGHGTHMAGIVAGRDSGSFRGVAPGAHLVSLKVASREGAADVSQVIAAIDWVVQHRADPGMNIRVLNLSYGTDGVQDYRADPLAKAVEEAARHGIVVVVSGGNDGSDRPALTNPATDPYVLAVGAVNLKGTSSVLDDIVAPFSSRGSATRSVDLVAPGVSITSLRDPGSSIDTDHPSSVVQDRFLRGSGTSQAAAVVSGAAALLLDARPDLSADQVKRLLVSTASPLLLTSARAQGAGR
ncbi:MAG: serine protease AprX, partial [Actinomycetota bacterium]|nr:serine protease AprX [Actinomycetota bacterium]